MKAIIENGGVTIATHYIKTIKLRKLFASDVNKLQKLMIFNWYLNTILVSNSANELRERCSDLESQLHVENITNPFHFGFDKDGFGVYEKLTETRVIFVECETDLEL